MCVNLATEGGHEGIRTPALNADPSVMQSPIRRRDRIERIENEISRLGELASELLEREEVARTRLGDLRHDAGKPVRRVRRARLSRAIGRAERHAERHAEKLRSRREGLVEGDLRSIMLALEKESRRTRERLDQQLERLAPLEGEWERLCSVFGSIEAAVAAPALEQVECQWRGALEIPEFPVRENSGYDKPFPHRALLF